MWLKIDDPCKAWELYEAGLLWERYRGNVHQKAANGWVDLGHIRTSLERGNFTFYVLLEE